MITVPPLAKLDSQGLLLNVTAGIEVILNCTSLGYPFPTITWLKDDLPLTQNNSFIAFNYYVLAPITINELVIQDPRIVDTGTYRCISTNHLVRQLSNESGRVEIQVYCKCFSKISTSASLIYFLCDCHGNCNNNFILFMLIYKVVLFSAL